MAVLSGLGFSRLIKTVVPGLLLVGIIISYVDLVASLAGRGDPLFQWTQRNVSLAAALALPISVVLGIISNMMVFGWANDRLIRNKFDREHPGVGRFEQTLLEAATQIKAGRLREDLIAANITLDLDYLLMGEIDLGKWTFLQDSYWYYLEFQMNMSLVTAFAIPLLSALSVEGLLRVSAPAWTAMVAAAFVVSLGAIILVFLIKTARLNYAKHHMKRLSLLVTALDSAANARENVKKNTPLERTMSGRRKRNQRRVLH